ncbi:Phage protein [Mucinivorans hirudinis]|uniref:Phage protein n=1 Tax=Mucinivorans hirudinis TaxID=1433126 RepID=A0A060R6I4_9BACT|nr:Phage protein [Mucinivorans hirudinis]
MAVISRGQITIVDLADGKSINLYLGSNVATTQIFNKENSSYVPNWTLSPFLVITPEVYVTGVDTNQVSRLKGVPTWKINGSTTLSTYGATAATTSPYALTIKNNMTSVNQLQVECEVVYVDPDTTTETKAKTNISYTKSENAGQLICAIAFAPLGTVFKNGAATTLKAHCDMWRGSTIDNTNVTYKWFKLGSGT